MLLPISFFMFCRKNIVLIVLEKEKDILEYLKMNGMSQTAYNIAFILHETFINGPLICICLDLLCYWRLEPKMFIIENLLCFNLAIVIFIAGTTAIALLISKGFNSSGFATQIGSMLFLVPIFLSLYLRVLEYKHRFAEYANSGYDEMDHKSIRPGDDHTIYPKR